MCRDRTPIAVQRMMVILPWKECIYQAWEWPGRMGRRVSANWIGFHLQSFILFPHPIRVCIQSFDTKVDESLFFYPIWWMMFAPHPMSNIISDGLSDKDKIDMHACGPLSFLSRPTFTRPHLKMSGQACQGIFFLKVKLKYSRRSIIQTLALSDLGLDYRMVRIIKL